MGDTPHTQLTLDLPVRTALERADFLVAPSNKDAVEWLDKWPDWPIHVLVVVGPPKSGKTHLAHVWREQADAYWHEQGGLDGCLEQAGQGRSVCLDIDGDIEDEEALFHLYNWSKEHGANLLITACEPPKAWDVKLPDLRSRLLACNVVAMGAPDDQLLAAVMVKLFSDRQVAISEDVLRYLVSRIERSFESAARVVDQLDQASMAEGRAVTVPLAKQVLAF
jgi:DnaA regulatory inactivator Hda